VRGGKKNNEGEESTTKPSPNGLTKRQRRGEIKKIESGGHRKLYDKFLQIELKQSPRDVGGEENAAHQRKRSSRRGISRPD